MTRLILLAAVLVTAARGLRAQADTTQRPPAARPPADTSIRDTVTRYLPVLPTPAPPGPLPRGSRYSFTADSFAFSDTKTLSDVLTRIPGVFVARGGLYGQAEAVLYGGRGPAALEVYWDGVPYLPLGRDSVYLDPARIPLAPLERVDVIVLPGTLRVYLVTRRQSSTAPSTEVGITTGQFNTSGYRASFLKRWRGGTGLSLVADWSDIAGASGSSTTSFHDVDLWLKAEYVPSPKVGVSYQIVSSDWHRGGSAAPPLVDPSRSKRADGLLRAFVAARPDGLGPRLDLTLTRTTLSNDSLAGARSVTQAMLEASAASPRASVGVSARFQEDRSPLTLDGRASWSPLHPFTVSADARHAVYELSRSGNRAHLSAGIELPLGFSVRGDLAWADDLDAPTRSDDVRQRTTDVSGAVRWQRSWVTLDVGGGRREGFVPPPEFPTGLRGVTELTATPATRYLSAHGTLRPLPGLALDAWYVDPLQGGGDFEPPRHARGAVTFYSKFWRVYKSGIFALRAEGAVESWSGGGGAGVFRDSTGVVTTLLLSGATFMDVNVQLRIAGVTIFWVARNARAFRAGYLPGADYPRNYQFYGVLWRFTN